MQDNQRLEKKILKALEDLIGTQFTEEKSFCGYLNPETSFTSFFHNGSLGEDSEKTSVFAWVDGKFVELPEVVGEIHTSNYYDVEDYVKLPECKIGEALKRRGLEPVAVYICTDYRASWSGQKPEHKSTITEYVYKEWQE